MLLQTKHLSYHLHGKTLVSDVALSVASGEVVALLGPNGAGKSTLLKLLCGQNQPTEGAIFFQDKLLEDWAPREIAQRRAVLPQSSSVPFDFTALEVVLLGRSPHGDSGSCMGMAHQAMALTESLHLADRVITTLSGGEMQRVHLARVLVQIWAEEADPPPRLLMLDEPISNLDPAHQHGALQIARNISRANVGVLVVLHELNLAAQYSDRIVLMKSGRIAAAGKPSEVLTEKNMADVFNVRASIVSNPLCGAPAIFVEPLLS